MINSYRDNDQITLFHKYADPLVLRVSDIIIATPIQNEPYLLIRVKIYTLEKISSSGASKKKQLQIQGAIPAE